MAPLRSVLDANLLIKQYQVKWIAESYVRDLFRRTGSQEESDRIIRFVLGSIEWTRHLQAVFYTLLEGNMTLYEDRSRHQTIEIIETLTREHIKNRIKEIKKYMSKNPTPCA